MDSGSTTTSSHRNLWDYALALFTGWTDFLDPEENALYVLHQSRSISISGCGSLAGHSEGRNYWRGGWRNNRIVNRRSYHHNCRIKNVEDENHRIY